MKKQYNKKMTRTILSIGTAFFFILLLVVGSSYFYIRQKIYMLPQQKKPNNEIANEYIGGKDENSDEEEIEEYKVERRAVKEKSNYQVQKGITNILLIGTDARSLEESARSDSIIIASIDENKKNIKLTSIMRDSYVNIKGFKSQKINAALALGGPELLMNTIERNFNIMLDKYILVNFWGFQDIVDGIGGIEVDVKDYEINEINKYIGEVSKIKSPKLSRTGMQNLDGQQALAYSRIRHAGNGSYERNSRQRIVLTTILNKLKDTSIFQYPTLLSKVLPHVRTNIEPATIMNYAYTAFSFKPLEVKQLQIPLDELSVGRIYKGTWVFLMDREQNGDALNNFIFKDITPSKEKFDYAEYKRVINEYLRTEKKSKPTIKYYIPKKDLESWETDQSIFDEYE